MLESNPLDFEGYRKELNTREWEVFDPGIEVRSVYVGSVMGLTPSGKYYTFWTTTQTEEEVEADMEWWARNQEAAERLGLVLEASDLDPLDVLISEYRSRGRQTVEEAAKERGLKLFDTALPQAFVDNVRDTFGMDVRGNFVWAYDKGIFGISAPITPEGDAIEAHLIKEEFWRNRYVDLR